jgi:hypothetical protein
VISVLLWKTLWREKEELILRLVDLGSPLNYCPEEKLTGS